MCGTDGRALKLPLPPSVPGQAGTDGNGWERTGNAPPTRTTKPDPMKPRRFYESSRIPEITAIVQQGRYAQMLAYLMSLAERAALAAEREAAKAKAKAKPKKGKRATKKPRARRE